MKTILRAAFCLIAVSLINVASAQTTGYLSFPDAANNNQFARMIHTSDGGFISVGSSGSAQSNHDITKWDSNFHVVWYKNYASAAVLYWNDVIETNDGNFIAMGENQNHTGCNIITKLDAIGNVLWQKEYYLNATFLTSFALSKAAGNDPGFVFGGGACGASNYIVRCDANGNIVWQQEYYITGMSGVESVETITAENNAYIITGNVLNGSANDAYALKIDSSNAMLWCKVMTEPTLNQIPSKCLKLANGSYAVLCGFNSNPNYCQMLYYFDTNGNVTNGIKLSSPTQQEINFGDMVEVQNGRIMLNGSVNASPMSYLYMELNAAGGIVWQKKGVGVNVGFLNGTGNTIARTSSNLFALGGGAYTDGKTVAVIDSTGTGFCNSTAGTIVSGPADAYTAVSTTPMIIAVTVLSANVTNTSGALVITQSVLCGALGTTENSIDASSLNIYPNPATNEITLDFGDHSFNQAEVSFYNMLGEKVSSAMVNSNSSTINISQLASGIYMMEVLINGEKIIKKVIKD